MTFHYSCMHCVHWEGEDKRGLRHEPGRCAVGDQQTSPFDRCARLAAKPYEGPPLFEGMQPMRVERFEIAPHERVETGREDIGWAIKVSFHYVTESGRVIGGGHEFLRK